MGQQHRDGEQRAATDKLCDRALTELSNSSLLLQINNSNFLYCSGQDFSISEVRRDTPSLQGGPLQSEVFVFLCFTNVKILGGLFLNSKAGKFN